MQKQFLKKLSLVMLLAMALSILVILGLQTAQSQNNALETERVQLEQVQKRIDANNVSIAALKESTNADSLAKARAFARMVAYKPEIIGSAAELEAIKSALDVDELHVVDGKGILTNGTEPGMFGFDFSTNEQTKPFLMGIKDKGFGLAQEAQPNAVNGDLFQYVGVARQDAPGVIQVGLRPQRLEEALKSNEIAAVLSGMPVGTNGYILAVSLADSTIVAHNDSSLVGKRASEIGLPEDFTAGDGTHGFARIDGTPMLYLSVPYDDYMIAAVMPRSEVYSGRNLLIGIFAVIIAIIFLVLIVLINRMLRRQIISGIDRISGDLCRITGGDLGVVVDVRTTREFAGLSDGINEMVGSIRAKIEETNQLAEKEHVIFRQVQEIADNIHVFSGKMLDMAQSLSGGAEEQRAATEALSGSFQQVSGRIEEMADKAGEARGISESVKKQLTAGNREMDRMVHSMNEISEGSKKIGSIIKSIDDIAFQTNILALNAAVEAARAGVAGKGFAVVADEVRSLAGKSAESAKSTASLIDGVLKAIDQGVQNVTGTAETLSRIIGDAAQSATLIEGISTAADEQKNAVAGVVQEIDHISAVVRQNSMTSAESAEASRELAAKTDSLNRLVNENADTAPVLPGYESTVR